MLTRERIGALVLLVGCAGYGALARQIELYPGAEQDVITARTLPRLLAWLGCALAAALVLRPPQRAEDPLWRTGHWTPLAGLLLAMIGYALALGPIGFLLATSGFLLSACLVLGERRPLPLLLLPLGTAAGFELLLRGVLGVYIEDPLLRALGLPA